MPYLNHEAGRDCLLELDDVLQGVGCPYFLMQGTALGAYRDGGFTPTEKDIDLGILYEHLAPRVPQLVTGLCSRGFDIELISMPFTRVRTLVAFKAYRGHVVKADIVGVVKWKGLRFNHTLLRDWTERPYALVHAATLVEKWRKTAVLWGREFNIPEDIETYLACEYGVGWRVPADDHISRTRMYNFVEIEGIPLNWLEGF